MGVHVFPILNPHTHLPPHPIPLGHPSAPAPSTLYHASNLAWRFISHMIIYMFQCHCPKSCHPRPLPQSPKDCSIHIYIYTHTCVCMYILWDITQSLKGTRLGLSITFFSLLWAVPIIILMCHVFFP